MVCFNLYFSFFLLCHLLCDLLTSCYFTVLMFLIGKCNLWTLIRPQDDFVVVAVFIITNVCDGTLVLCISILSWANCFEFVEIYMMEISPIQCTNAYILLIIRLKLNMHLTCLRRTSVWLILF